MLARAIREALERGTGCENPPSAPVLEPSSHEDLLLLRGGS